MTYNNQPRNKRIAILIENGVEDPEFQVPYKAVQMAGFEVVVLGSRMNERYVGKQGRHVAELYRTRMGASVQSAKPTTGAAVKI